MIVVDPFALIAILGREPDAALFRRKRSLRRIPPLVSAAALLELHIVMLNPHGGRAAQIVDRLIQDAGFPIEHFTAQHLELAREAYARYGKGRNSAGAQLWRLLFLRAGKSHWLAVAFQGGGVFKNGLGRGVGQYLSKESRLTHAVSRFGRENVIGGAGCGHRMSRFKPRLQNTWSRVTVC